MLMWNDPFLEAERATPALMATSGCLCLPQIVRRLLRAQAWKGGDALWPACTSAVWVPRTSPEVGFAEQRGIAGLQLAEQLV